LKDLSRRHAELAPLAARVRQLLGLEREMADLDVLLSGSDAEMRGMAAAERPVVSQKVAALEEDLRLELVPKDPNDARSVFLEIRAGAGGDEAALFRGRTSAALYPIRRRPRVAAELVDLSSTGLKGVKQAILFIQGQDVFSWLRYEGGVHRVHACP